MSTLFRLQALPQRLKPVALHAVVVWLKPYPVTSRLFQTAALRKSATSSRQVRTLREGGIPTASPEAFKVTVQFPSCSENVLGTAAGCAIIRSASHPFAS